MMAKKRIEEIYDPDEVARRADEVVRRMANTPPQPRPKSSIHRPKKKKPAGEGRADRKNATRDEGS